eukprot:m51a1_g112 hypothetical protein (296) ;mRNA; r:347672-348636
MSLDTEWDPPDLVVEMIIEFCVRDSYINEWVYACVCRRWRSLAVPVLRRVWAELPRFSSVTSRLELSSNASRITRIEPEGTYEWALTVPLRLPRAIDEQAPRKFRMAFVPSVSSGVYIGVTVWRAKTAPVKGFSGSPTTSDLFSFGDSGRDPFVVCVLGAYSGQVITQWRSPSDAEVQRVEEDAGHLGERSEERVVVEYERGHVRFLRRMPEGGVDCPRISDSVVDDAWAHADGDCVVQFAVGMANRGTWADWDPCVYEDGPLLQDPNNTSDDKNKKKKVWNFWQRRSGGRPKKR